MSALPVPLPEFDITNIAFLQALLDASPTAQCIYHVANDQLVYTSRQFGELLGMSDFERQIVAEHSLVALVHSDDQERLVAHYSQVARQLSARRQTIEFRMLHKDGSWRWVRSSAQAFVGQSSDFGTLVLVSLEDSSRAMLLNQELRQYKQLIELSPDALLLWEPSKGLLEWNRGSQLLYGFQREDVLGLDIHQLLKTEWPESFAAYQAELWNDGFWSGEITQTTRDGQRVVVYSKQQLLVINNQMWVIESNRDVTNHKHTQQVLRASRDFSQLVLENSSDCVKVMDTSGVVLQMNTPGMTLMEIEDFETFRGKPWVSMCPQEERDVVEQAVTRARDGWRNRFQAFGPTAKGTPKWWDVSVAPIYNPSGQVTQLLSISRDVTEQKLLEAERTQILAHEQQARSRADQAILQITQLQAATALLSQTLTYEQVADIAERMLPSLRAERGLLAMCDHERTAFVPLLSPTNALAAELMPYLPIDEVANSQQPVWIDAHTTAYLYPSLAERDRQSAAWAVLPLVGSQGLLGVFVLSFTHGGVPFDEPCNSILAFSQLFAQALERIRLYEQNRQARDTAATAVLARDQFLSIAAHELRNPLTVLLGNTQILERRLRGSGILADQDAHSLRTIIDQGMRLNRMLTTLLDVSRIEQGQLDLFYDRIDLHDLVSRIIDEQRSLHPKHKLVSLSPGTPLVIWADEVRMEQVIQNLLSNAFKYSPAGGTITVELTNQDDSVSLRVSDEGIGIPRTALPHVFQRFYRVPGDAGTQIEGAGVGLYVVKEIVNRHHGTISVESKEGLGSHFTVTLPTRESEQWLTLGGQ